MDETIIDKHRQTFVIGNILKNNICGNKLEELMLKSCAIFLEVVLKLSIVKILTMKLLIKVVTLLVETLII
jgi:hypothetical protein